MGSNSRWTPALLKSVSELPLLSVGLQVHPPPVRAGKQRNPWEAQGKVQSSLTRLKVKISKGWKAQPLSFPAPGQQLDGCLLASVSLRVSKHLIFHPSHCCRAVGGDNSNAACWKCGEVGNSTSKPSCAVSKCYYAHSTEKNRNVLPRLFSQLVQFCSAFHGCNSIYSVTRDRQGDGTAAQRDEAIYPRPYDRKTKD